MDADTTNRLFCIICISCVPVVTLLILFCLLVVALSRHRTIDVITCSLLLGRLGHTCAVVVMMSVYTLENWSWGKSVCQAFVWMWVTFWTLDLFINILFLLYNSLRLGQSKKNTRCHMVLMVTTSWGLAILTGAFTFMTDWMFHNLSETGCYLGLSNGEQPIRVAAMFVIIIGGLLIIVLTITVSAESRAQSLKYKLQHPDVIQATNSTKRISIRQNGELLHRDPAEVYQIIDMTLETPDVTSNGQTPTHKQTPNGTITSQSTRANKDNMDNGNNRNNSNNNINNNNSTSSAPTLESENVRTWRYIDRQMRDLRHLHGTATSCTILLNLLPQLVLYSMDSVSGSPYTYGHHILVAAGLVHALILPVAFCTTGLRYRAIADRLIRDTCSSKATSPTGTGEPHVMEEKIVFHIQDVTLTDSTDSAPEALRTADRPISSYSTDRVQSVHSVQESSSQPNDRDWTITTEADISPVPVAILASQQTDTLQGTINPGYQDTENDSRPVYGRSQSDGVVDYYSDDGSWDSDSETWSNLYDESDIEEVLYDGMKVGSLKSNRLSPNTLTRARRSSTLPNSADFHHRRKLSHQMSTPIEGSPSRSRRKSVDEDSRRRRKKSRHRRRASRDLVGDLAPMMQLGIASAVIAKNTKKDEQNTASDVPLDVPENITHEAMDSRGHDCYCESESKDLPEDITHALNTEQTVTKKVSFGSELAATANKFRKSYDEQEAKRIEQVKMNELIKESRKTRNARKLARKSSSSYVNGKEQYKIPVAPPLPENLSTNSRTATQIPVAPPLPDNLFSGPPPKPPRQPDTDNVVVKQLGDANKANTSQRRHSSNLSEKLRKSILRHHSSTRSSRQSSLKLQTPTTNVRASAPGPQLTSRQTEADKRQSLPPEMDPALAGMTLDKIMKNPFLTDMLRQSLESLDSGNEAQTVNSAAKVTGEIQDNVGPKDQSKKPNPFVSMLSNKSSADTVHSRQENLSPPPSTGFVSKACENVLYEIPTIDSDHRYRPRKPIRRGLYAFRAAARAVAISGFLKKSKDTTESNELDGNAAISDFLQKSRQKAQTSELDRNSSNASSFSVSSQLHYI